MIDTYDDDERYVVVPECKAVEERDTSIWVESPHFPNDTMFEMGRIWIPKNQIHDDSEVFEEDGDGDLIITEWIAKQKDLL